MGVVYWSSSSNSLVSGATVSSLSVQDSGVALVTAWGPNNAYQYTLWASTPNTYPGQSSRKYESGLD